MPIADTAIIVPAHNEAAVIEATIREVREVFAHVICVDDGSSDDTSTQARQGGARVLRHPVNLGQGAALQTGIEYALTLPVEYFCSFDADGQHRVEDVVAMRQRMVDDPVDIVLGSRFLGHDPKDMPLGKRLLLRGAVRFANATSGVKLTDAHNGLRLFNRHVAQTIDLQEPGYQHASEFVARIHELGYAVAEMPVTIRYTEYSLQKGQSMMNAVNIAADTLVSKAVHR
ncbi:MAG: glycosyltransferase family 2 protein [Propionibacteriaceae bacterium]|nr:glycosyltransferase family 2 protein [Propionibacteriaceae bacterium]